MKKRVLFYVLGLALLFGTLEALHFAYREAARRKQPSLEEEVRAIEARYAQGAASPGAVLFVGSSSIRRWENLSRDMHPIAVLNHGFGGSELTHILEYQEALIERHRPRAIVIYSGDNDLGKHTDNTSASVIADYQELVSRLMAWDPKLRVYCLSIKASPSRMGRWPLMKAVNRAMHDWCAERDGTRFLDVSSPLLDERGLPRFELYLEDGIHLNEAGYARWTPIIQSALLADQIQ